MTLVDANILLYDANRSAPEHEVARDWLDRQLSGTARVGLPWPSLLAFALQFPQPKGVIQRHPWLGLAPFGRGLLVACALAVGVVGLAISSQPSTEKPEENPCQRAGSIIECQNQFLGEQVALTGKPRG